MIMWVSIAVAIATALRADGGPPRALLIAVALSYAAFAGTLTAFQETRVMQKARQSLTTYLAGSVLLMGLLCLLAVLDSGVMTIFFAPIVQVAMYLGLVLPKLWARLSLAMLVLSVALVEVLHPTDAGPQAALLAALTIAAWQVGRVCHRAHDSTAQAARRIAHTDVLTGCLNRRGFVLDVQTRIAGSRPGRGLALLLLDLDQLATINDDQGRGAGDRALAWAGEQLAAAVPDGGTVGRLGGNDFAVALPNTSARDAGELAASLRAMLGPRIGCQVGIAISEDPGTAVDDFLRVALASQQAASASDAAPRALVAGSTRGARYHAPDDDGQPDVTYEQVRRARRRETAPAAGVRFGRVARDGFWVIGFAGAVVIVAAVADGIDSAAERAMLWAGPIWVLANLALGWVIGRQQQITDTTARIARLSSSVLVSVGVSLAMVASGGIATPIVAALYLKTMFDAAVTPTKSAAASTAITLVGWAVAALFTPLSELWVIPYQLTLFVVSFGLGAVGRRAFLDARSEQLRLAHTDVLTGLRNRRGFMQGAERAFAAAVDGAPLTLIAFDVDAGDRDPDARDELLRDVAGVMRDAFPGAYSLSRLGGEEFCAAIPAASVAEASALAGVLAARLANVAPASIGCAVYPHDGDTLEALLLRADHRSYASNTERTRHSPLSVSDGSAAA